MKLKLFTSPSKMLGMKCKKIKQVKYKHRELAASMHYWMKQWKGIGLSAPQVGRDIQVIVGNTIGKEKNGQKITMFNPEIVEHSDKINSDAEGCLSYPGVYYKVDRPDEITIKYLNKDMKK